MFDESTHSPLACPRVDQTSVLYQFFDRAAQRWPDAVAVDVPPAAERPGRRSISYRELRRQSDLLACAVHARVGGGRTCAILLPRTTERLQLAQLAVLKSGSAFVCIDPAFPNEQLRHILEDSQPAALLTDGPGLSRARHVDYPGSIVRVDTGFGRSPGYAPPLPAPPPTESAAYITYTSGTTGRPRGVTIAHRSICNLVSSDISEFGLGPGDRVAQGSSAAYDSSVEETWMALSTGAAVVVIDDETARLGPDLIPWLRDERITALCPPPTLLRATGGNDPERELPDLRLLYVGGEALPEDVVERWARGRRMVNGYGPTECTVTCLRCDVYPGEPIAIGYPVPGMRAWVLDERLEPVNDGERGELCLGGVGLALGYHNRPDLDAAKFPQHPRLGRVYRTGDLVHAAADGALIYHGRIDSQVKLRGYRIELEAIEACLARCEGVREAACRVQGEGAAQVIAAHVVPSDTIHPPDLHAVKHRLRDSLPDYMVPALLGTIEALPRSPGGKVLRSRLPALLAGDPRRTSDAPSSPPEERIAQAVSRVLALPHDPCVQGDFFNDLGGSSLQAAMLVSELRRETSPLTSITVRDVYEARTVSALARRAVAPPAADDVEPVRQSSCGAGGATAIQVIWLLMELLIFSPLAYLIVFRLLPWLVGSIGLTPLILLAPLVLTGASAVFLPLSVMVTVLAKKVLIGRYTPMRAPVWGNFFLRSWIMQQVVRTIPWRLIEGTEFQCIALRALGARIGKRVHIHRGVRLLHGGWDLLEIGDDVTISQDASVRLVTLEEGQVVVGPVTLADGATLDVRSGAGPYTHVGRNSWLTALSALPTGATIPDGEMWDGIPAGSTGPAPEPATLTQNGRRLSPRAHGLAMMTGEFLFWELLLVPFQVAAVAFVSWFHLEYEDVLTALSHPHSHCGVLGAAAALFTLALICTVGMEAVAERALGTVAEGAISRWSIAYIRVWMKARIVQSAGNWLSGALSWPVWLRWAGMKVGRGCEVSKIIDVIPELIQIGPESFLADGIYLGGPRIQRGTVTLANVRLGTNTFLGNHAVVAGGQNLPENVLLGICTVADDRMARPRSSWFGHPPFELPRREIVECSRNLTHEPSTIRFINRLFWEWLRFTLPIIPMLVLVVWMSGVSAAYAAMPSWLFFTLGLSGVAFGCASLLCGFVLALKWALLGKVRPGVHPLWSCWCSRWDFLYVAWGVIASGVLAPLEGTLILASYLRRMGMRIGRRVVLGGGFARVVDPDMIEIGDGATVNAMFQAHTFEDRVLKIDHIRLGPASTMADNTVPLYGADVGAHTYVAPHSVIMKHEQLWPGLRYEGAPTQRQQEPQELDTGLLPQS